MPGKKDFVSVKQGGKRLHVQKRLVLSNLKEVYCEFKRQFPDYKLGFQNLLNFAPNTAFWLELVVHTLYVCAQYIKMSITHLFFKMLHKDFIGIIHRQHFTLLLPTSLIQESYVI